MNDHSNFLFHLWNFSFMNYIIYQRCIREMNGIAPLLSSWNTHRHTRVSTNNNAAIYPVFSTRIIVARI